jgi:RHS repeat-associated protein
MELRGKADGSGTEPVSPGTLTSYLFAGGQRVAALEDGVLSYFHQDHLGGTALITNEDGFVTQLYDYYPYGSELQNTPLDDGTGEPPAEHSFTDKELDEDLGLYYFEARWYDSEIGRFSSQDPAQLDDLAERKFTFTNDMNEFLKKNKIFDPQMLNFYSYSLNNPIVYIDPDGETPIGIFVSYLLTFFSDIPSAGDSGDLINSGPTNDHNDGDISNNMDDVLWHSTKGQAPWYVRIGMFVYEQTLITVFGEEKDLTYNEEGGYSVYTVQPGDTMYELFGDDYQEIAEFNGFEDPNTINVGEEIRIPVESEKENTN